MKKLERKETQVVLIGIHTYDNEPEFHDLRHAFKDVADLANIFGSEMIGIPQDNIHQMIDVHDKSLLLDKLKRIVLREATKNLIMYYAGHGVLDDKNDKAYLSLSRSTLDTTGIYDFSLEDLEICFSGVPNLNVILILDCCFSERAFQDINNRNYCIIASSARNESSIYPKGVDNSAFTGEFISVLKNGIDNKNAYISFREIYHEAKKKLQKNGFPLPKLAAANDVQDIKFSKNNFGILPIKRTNYSIYSKSAYIERDLFDALHHLDYSAQKGHFNDFLMDQRFGAIVIHGKCGYGQNWLFKTLLRQKKLDTSVSSKSSTRYWKRS